MPLHLVVLLAVGFSANPEQRPETGNALVVRSTNSSQGRNLADRFAEVANVKDFGAVGNGMWSGSGWKASDDTAAIQAAVESLPCGTYTRYAKPLRCGGEVIIPPGVYKVTAPINLHRGIRVRGSSREATQIVVAHGGSAFRYEDAGIYVPDEIGIDNLSIWQDVNTQPISGAAIEVNGGSASPQSVSVRISNVSIEGTYHGILMAAVIGGSVRDTTISRTVSHGVYVKYDPSARKYATQTTSMTFQNTYSYFGRGDGFRFEASSYVTCVSCASDSNAGYGYSLATTINMTLLSCGAERNALGGVKLASTQNTVLSMTVVHSGTVPRVQHGVVLHDATDTTLIGGWYSAVGASGGLGVKVESGDPPIVIGTKFTGRFGGDAISNVALPKISAAGADMRAYRLLPLESLRSCDASLEGVLVRASAAGGRGSGLRTKLCVCTSDGSDAPYYAWQNVATARVGDARTCP